MGSPGSVIVVGGGPAGALSSFLLARGGVRVTLVERHSDFSREFRGEGMSPAGMAAIREAGLWEQFDQLPAAPLKSVAMYSGGKPLLTLDLENLLPAGTELLRVLAQPHLLEMLVAEASKFPNFTFLRGVLVREPIVEAGRVRGIRIEGNDRTETELRADYVIAADGRYSTMRKSLGLELAGEPQIFDVVWCKVDRPRTMEKGRVYSFLLEQFFALAIPMEGDRVQIGRIIPKGGFKSFRSGEEGGWADKIAASLPADIAPGFEEVRASEQRPTLLDVICGSLPKWSVAGLCFIGDAAHPMSPIGAQGINVALRDAVVAANHFGLLLLEGGSATALDEAAVTFETERRREVDKIQKQQSEAPRRLGAGRWVAGLLRFVPDDWIAGLARRLIGLRSTQNFIRGVSDLHLTFGKTSR